MSLTGLFLITFLIVHVSGNMLLFKDDGGEAFNLYAEFMTTSPMIRLASIILYSGLLLHVIYSVVLTIYNQRARPIGYNAARPNENSSWKSRNMGVLGTLVFIFLVIHMRNFWWEMHYGDIPVKTYAGTEVTDLYTVVAASFANWWYSALYILSMIALGYHLAHGFWSAFHTVGLNNKKYMPLLKKAALFFSIIVPLLFASMPIYFYIKSIL